MCCFLHVNYIGHRAAEICPSFKLSSDQRGGSCDNLRFDVMAGDKGKLDQPNPASAGSRRAMPDCKSGDLGDIL